jgi:aryl-alcohol dehydrogenase-like predicted oxidoreductase
LGADRCKGRRVLTFRTGLPIKTIQRAIGVGINLIDTAPVYGFGHSEEIVGKALAAGGRRDKAVLATKVGLDWVNGKVYRNSTPERIRKEIEASLQRLRTDRIDLYQVHWPDPLVPIEETAETLLELQRESWRRRFTPFANRLEIRLVPNSWPRPPT